MQRKFFNWLMFASTDWVARGRGCGSKKTPARVTAILLLAPVCVWPANEIAGLLGAQIVTLMILLLLGGIGLGYAMRQVSVKLAVQRNAVATAASRASTLVSQIARAIALSLHSLAIAKTLSTTALQRAWKPRPLASLGARAIATLGITSRLLPTPIFTRA
ncbi:hypothetical protein [Thiomonas delicata]|uniref:hypothetical protein n=1 Tax=Thiomonas delicata TaxID=364030 RepID=UPI00113FF097|nr:hypothetical protein [Thiomonas delicata]